MSCTVSIIEDSVNPEGVRLTTFELRYWRAIHAELMTHRVFSRNASSSRAIPVSKMLSQVWNDPAGPIHWGANQSGMQAKNELAGINHLVAKAVWKWAGRAMCVAAWTMTKVGLHKQVANRLLEPWQYINVVLSATEFTNWFDLRDHKDAQPEIQELAREMAYELSWSNTKKLQPGEWHLPYITLEERVSNDLTTNIKCSVARCARVSYLTHGDNHMDVLKDMHLYDRLVGARPWHASPLEHQATPKEVSDITDFSGNFDSSWVQYRKLFEAGVI